MRKLKILDFIVDKVETLDFPNQFKRSTEHNQSYHEPMVFCVKVGGRVRDTRAYFSHHLEFTRYKGLSDGDFFPTKETDFVRIEEFVGPKYTHNKVHLKIKVGQKLRLLAFPEERPGSSGTYLKLTYVSMKPEPRDEVQHVG